jgi:SOS response regulatory protein OraA/RecX
MTRVILKRVLGERPTGEKMIEIKLIEKSSQEADRELIIKSCQRNDHKKFSEKMPRQDAQTGYSEKMLRENSQSEIVRKEEIHREKRYRKTLPRRATEKNHMGELWKRAI